MSVHILHTFITFSADFFLNEKNFIKLIDKRHFVNQSQSKNMASDAMHMSL